ncbi:MAG: hypothetical protein IJR66_04290 [Clostridia bacterium]|nr:hypothetical protein [Clostridia bacterium]
MISETCGANEIALFKAVEFPFKWEKERVIANMKGADTTPISFNEEVYFTIDIENPYKDMAATRGKNLLIINNCKRYKIYDNNVKVRPAGHLIYDDNTIIRPAQDSSIGYGDGVIFYEIDNIDASTYKERKLFEVLPSNKQQENDVVITLKNSKKIFSGIHTYNVNEDYEIIDLAQRNVFSGYGACCRLLRMIKRKFRNGK